MDMFSSGNIGKLRLQNRIIRSATNDHLGEPDGKISDEQVALYEVLGRNHLGMIITGHFGVDPEFRAAFNQPLISDDRFISSAAGLADAVHRGGGLICGQISQAGLNSISNRFDINTVSEKEISDCIRKFASGAKRLQQAGYDSVQIHLAHGYFLANVLDDSVNLRTDQYGGNAFNRFRIIREAIAAVKENCGDDYSIIIKMSSNNRALTEYDKTLIFYAQELEKCGIDALEISGWNFHSFPPETTGYYLREALMLKQTVGIPVIPVGGFFDRRSIEKALAAGVDFVSCCRAFFCESDFVTQILQGKEGSRCRQCWRCRTLYKTEFRNCIFHEESSTLRRLFSKN